MRTARGAKPRNTLPNWVFSHELAHDIALCHEPGLSALVEAYDPAEVPRTCAAGARIVGVNNRDLATFQVDFGRSIEQRPLVGPDRLFVSESGVRTEDDVARLSRAGVDAVLIGETLMRAGDPEAALAGGLTPGNVAHAIRSVRPWAVDLSSGLETAGLKDPEKIAAAVQTVRALDKEEQ